MSTEPDKSLDIVDVETCPAYDDEDYRYYVEFMFKTSDGAWHNYWLPENTTIKLVDYLLNELWQFGECRKNATLPITRVPVADLTSERESVYDLTASVRSQRKRPLRLRLSGFP